MNFPRPLTIILMGIQGSGKGTQARLLHDRFNFAVLDAGQILRNKSQEQSPIGARMREILASGNLLPNEITAPLVLDELIRIPEDKNLVIDGFPRTQENAQSLEEMLVTSGRKPNAIVIHLVIPEELAITRLSLRKICISCGKIFGKDAGDTCDSCGGTLQMRSDSSPEASKKRIEWHWEMVNPIIESYRAKYPFFEFNGDLPVEDLHRQLVQLLGL